MRMSGNRAIVSQPWLTGLVVLSGSTIFPAKWGKKYLAHKMLAEIFNRLFKCSVASAL